MIAAIDGHAATSRAGIERAAAEVVAGIDALHGEASARLEADHAQAVSDLGAQAEAQERAAEAETSAAIDGLTPHAIEAAGALAESGADASAAINDCPTAAEAGALAQEARTALGQAAAQATAELASMEQRQGAALDQRAAAGLAGMGQLVQNARAASQQTVARVAAEIQRAQSGAGRAMAEGGATAAGQMAEATAQASAELDRAARTFSADVTRTAEQARSDISAGVDQSLAAQSSNLGQAQAKKQEATTQIGAKYDALKSEAEGRSASEQQSRRGQRGFWGSLVSGWNKLTSAVKSWFASTFGDWLGGFLYGVLSAVVGLAIIIGVLALIAATGPIGAAIALGLGIGILVGAAGLGIYNRFQMFQAQNGRSPGLGEGTLLVLLGIADVTGAPQIIEGLAGKRAFSNGHTMDDFEAGESVGAGIVQLVAITFAIRGLKGLTTRARGTSVSEGKPAAEGKPVEAPEGKSLEAPEVKAPESKAPETESKPAKTTDQGDAGTVRGYYEDGTPAYDGKIEPSKLQNIAKESEWKIGHEEVKMDVGNGRVYQRRIHAETSEGEKLVIDIDYTNHGRGDHPAPHYHIYRYKGGSWSKKGNGIPSTGSQGEPSMSGSTYTGPQPWK